MMQVTLEKDSLIQPVNPVQHSRVTIMSRYRNKSLGWVFVSRMIGIICFLIVVVLANILTYYVASPLYHSGVTFVNENFWLLLLIAVILLIADLFGAFPFPLNLPAPIVKAIGSVFCIAFLLRVFQWVDTIADTNLYQTFWLISFLVIPLVFLIVLATGYFEIMQRLWWKPNLDPDTHAQKVSQESPGERDQGLSDAKTWEEIGSEFRMMVYDIIHRFRQEINKKQ
jgi:hypothetical protein